MANRARKIDECVARKDCAGAAAGQAELSIAEKRRKLYEFEQKEKDYKEAVGVRYIDLRPEDTDLLIKFVCPYNPIPGGRLWIQSV